MPTEFKSCFMRSQALPRKSLIAVALSASTIFLSNGIVSFAQVSVPASQNDTTPGVAGNPAVGAGRYDSGRQTSVSATAIINLLQRQPILLRGARIRLAQVTGVDPSTITDQMLFERIAQDEGLRQRIAEELRKKGYSLSEGWADQAGDRDNSQWLGSSANGATQANPWQTASSPQGGFPAPASSSASPTYLATGSPTQPSFDRGGQPSPTTENSRGNCLPSPQAQGSSSLLSSQCDTPGTPGAADASNTPSQTLTQQQVMPYADLPSLRDLYSQIRPVDTHLKRFGSDVFALGSGNTDTLPMDLPAGPDYVLGPGDELLINIWGSLSQTLAQTIDRQGQITLPTVGPVMVAGRTISQGQDQVRKALETQLQHANVEISLGKVHSVRVYVVGDVQRPGAYDISSLSTPLNALYAAGGPTSQGSLRILRHTRNDKLIGEIDLYDLLLRGVHSDVERLLPGDTILVPPAGPQVVVAGMVRRPAIYELKGAESLRDLIDLAGGVLATASLQQINVERVESHQRRTMLSVRMPQQLEIARQTGTGAFPKQAAFHSPSGESPKTTRVSHASLTSAAAIPADSDALTLKKLSAIRAEDGDTISVLPILPYNEQAVYIEGHVFRPGKYAYSEGMTVNDLLKSYQDVMPEPSDHAELVRLAPPDYRPITYPLNLADILQGNAPVPLRPFDVIRVFSRYELDPPAVTISGEVLRPGDYPMEKGMTVSALVNAAGGFRRSAYREQADLASYDLQGGQKAVIQHQNVDLQRALRGDPDADAVLKAGDVLSIRQITGWEDIGSSVTVDGEVGHPGVYAITDGERLSSVLRRAGGLRSTAFAAGAVFDRIEVRQLEEKTRTELMQRIRSQDLASSVISSGGSAQEQQQALAAMKQQQESALSGLREHPASGRVVIEITGDIASWENSSRDIEMRTGDVLTIPKKAGFVLVSGQVNSSAAITYVDGKTAGWYLSHAGGPTKAADRKNTFIVRADGSVIGRYGKFHASVLSTRVQPGDSIVVPEKFYGTPIWKSVLGVAQVMSATSLSAVLATRF